MTTSVTRDALEVSTRYVAPRTDTERRLAELWSERLAVSPVGVHDDFFELGGDSLLAADVQLAVDLEFGVEIAAWAVFGSPTIAELAAAIEAAIEAAREPG
jgi:acyl carrier protein